mmetsp:Transcript_1394/g.4374  ORF Transcript_1394/g.4374 Transcript_1394/m.4374 type:complete len:230 (-) Transcript_1394:36-725(-)
MPKAELLGAAHGLCGVLPPGLRALPVEPDELHQAPAGQPAPLRHQVHAWQLHLTRILHVRDGPHDAVQQHVAPGPAVRDSALPGQHGGHRALGDRGTVGGPHLNLRDLPDGRAALVRVQLHTVREGLPQAVLHVHGVLGHALSGAGGHPWQGRAELCGAAVRRRRRRATAGCLQPGGAALRRAVGSRHRGWCKLFSLPEPGCGAWTTRSNGHGCSGVRGAPIRTPTPTD